MDFMLIITTFIALFILWKNVRAPQLSAGQRISARVRFVIDGDTLIVTHAWHAMKIRLDSIDCPEDGQPWGEIAKAGLIKLIGGRDVELEIHGTDIYHRTLATIYVWHKSKFTNVNERMVMLGHAWVMDKYYAHLPDERKLQLHRLERWARNKRIGLWKLENPIPPWQWRKSA